jgi:hypothetical protein
MKLMRRTAVWGVGLGIAGAAALGGGFGVAGSLGASAQAGTGEITLTAGQLLINQRIAQAAVRRVNALQALVDGENPPAAGKGNPGAVDLSAGQLLISQRIAQAAVRRINSLTALVDGELEPKVDAGQKDRVALTVAQLRINQRIAQAAIRRADALAERIPDLPVPRPPENTASSDEIIGVAVAPRKVKILQVRRGPGTVGSTIALVLPPERRANNLFTGETVIAEGASAGTTFYAFYVSIEPGPNN